MSNIKENEEINQIQENLEKLKLEPNKERLFYRKGAGAFGYFQVTKPDIQKYCKANVFDKVGKKTDLAARFSNFFGDVGSSDTIRDIRGFAVKMYTKEGNWDLVGTNSPIFFISDPEKLKNLIKYQKGDPKTNLKNPDKFWKFISKNRETTHQVSLLFSDRGIPDGFRHMNGYGGHTYILINKNKEAVYTKFHWKVDQGIKNLDPTKPHKTACDDPDYFHRDLHEAIKNKDYPSWTLNVQIMTSKEAEIFQICPFDLTKVWLQELFPLIEVGKMFLNKNPDNYLTQVQQMVYHPSNLVPGIEASQDKMLQKRLSSHAVHHKRRLDDDYKLLEGNRDLGPNYDQFYSSEKNETQLCDGYRFKLSDIDPYSQVKNFFKILKPGERDRLAKNIAKQLVNSYYQLPVVSHFTSVCRNFAEKLQEEIKKFEEKNITMDILCSNDDLYTGIAGLYHQIKNADCSLSEIREADHVIPKEAYQEALKDCKDKTKSIDDSIKKIIKILNEEKSQMAILIRYDEHRYDIKSTGSSSEANQFREDVKNNLVKGEFKIAIQKCIGQYKLFGNKYNEGIRRVVDQYYKIKIISKQERKKLIRKFPKNEAATRFDFDMISLQTKNQFNKFKIEYKEFPLEITRALQIHLDYQRLKY